MSDEERKALELAAFGKRITFPTKHHWILTWLEELPGKSLSEKVYGIVDRAYRADYAERGYAALARYWQALEGTEYPDLNYPALIAASCDACECFGRAGRHDDEERARDLLRGAVAAQAKRARTAALLERTGQ